MLITRVSPFTGKINTMDLDVTKEQYVAWRNGCLLQDAFPQLNAGEREFLKTGITPQEWDDTFGDGEDSDDYPEEERV